MSALDFLAAIKRAQKEYPALSTLPLALTQGTGPFMSETFEPEDEENPLPGKLNIQLRSPELLEKLAKQPELLPQYIGAEALHGLQQTDPIYKQYHKQFEQSLTPDQLANMKRRYAKTPGENRPFNKFVDISEVPEYIRGFLFPEAIPGWTGPQGEGQYSPKQINILEQLAKYMKPGKREKLK